MATSPPQQLPMLFRQQLPNQILAKIDQTWPLIMKPWTPRRRARSTTWATWARTGGTPPWGPTRGSSTAPLSAGRSPTWSTRSPTTTPPPLWPRRCQPWRWRTLALFCLPWATILLQVTSATETHTQPAVTGASPRQTLRGPPTVCTVAGRQGMSRRTVRSLTLSQPFPSTGDLCLQQPSPMATSRTAMMG